MNFDYFVAPEKLVTPDFVLRTYYPGDGKLLNEAVVTSYEHLRTFLAWAKPAVALEESETLCRSLHAQYLTNKDFVLGIFSPDETRLLGGTGYHLRGTKIVEQTAEIGMWIRSDVAHKGLGSAVLQTLVKWGFEEWPWLRILWRCDTKNIASSRVAEKVGLLKEGIERSMYDPNNPGQRRDIATYAILKEEWGS